MRKEMDAGTGFKVKAKEGIYGVWSTELKYG